MRHFLLTILLIICFANVLFAQCKNEGCGLVIRGKVTNIEADRSDKNYVKFKIKLDVEFTNEGTENIILFKPEFDDRYWLGGWHLYLDLEETNAKYRKTILKEGYWQSVSGSKGYEDLAKKLDVKMPPNEYTKILQPNEVWKFNDDFQLGFEAKGPKYKCCVAWDEIQTFPSLKFQMQISYELSPWNIEYFKPNLIRKLQKRWKNYGNVLVENEKEGKSNHFIYSSEPMLIDFSKAKEKTSESKK